MWILACGLNMVENPSNRSTSTCSFLLGLKDELVQVDIKNKYNIKDYFSRGDAPIYSWDK